MSDSTLTQLLSAAGRGDADAAEAAIPEVYDALRVIAHNHLRREHEARTLSTTALVHEAYLRLAGSAGDVESRNHFLALASRLMRRILIDAARRRTADKRGGGAPHVVIDEALHLTVAQPESLLALDEALDTLATFDERQAQVVECRFFGGLTVPETADVLGVSPATVKREWTVAKAWLHRHVSG